MSARPVDRQQPAMQELLNHNRHAVAAAYRRLADEATRAAATLTDVEGNAYTDSAAHSRVLDRVESVKHARILLDATRFGYARAAASRAAS
jgi:4-aminobutyrate aminotransferase-like enzyme